LQRITRLNVKRTISAVVTAREEPPETLEITLTGLLAAGIREVIVIDDASLTPVRFKARGVSVIRNRQPLGVARSRRFGASLSGGEVLVFSDAHMRFAPDCFARMLEHVDSGALLCAAWWDYELTRPVCWGGHFEWCSRRDHKAGRIPGFSFRHLTRFPGEGAIEVPMVIGACYMVLRQSYEHIGGFSPFFRVWGRSEQDISARAWITGVGAKCVTAARAGHLSRNRFPYPVRFSDIEFNQIAMLRTTFEKPVARKLEELLLPLAPDVTAWLDQTDFHGWCGLVQSHRRMSDAEFFRRFVRDAPTLEEGVLTAAAADGPF
jgi:glycosyltransferase involved in cell wall biosynthesis